MTGPEIYRLSGLLPQGSPHFDQLFARAGNLPYYTPDIRRFIMSYNDPAFGWHFCRTFMDSRATLPPACRSRPLVRTVNHLVFGRPDPDVALAVAIDSGFRPGVRYALRAMLADPDADLRSIARDLGLPVPALDIYQELFFNVMDRKGETAYVLGIVYPDSRLVELDPDYARTAARSDLVLRAGYNGGLEAVRAFSGLARGQFGQEYAGDQASARLERLVSGTACFLAENGFYNARDMPALSAGKTFISSAKHGFGQSGSGSQGDPVTDRLGLVLYDEMRAYGLDAARARSDFADKLEKAGQMTAELP